MNLWEKVIFISRDFLGKWRLKKNGHKILPFLSQVDILSAIQRNKAISKWQQRRQTTAFGMSHMLQHGSRSECQAVCGKHLKLQINIKLYLSSCSVSMSVHTHSAPLHSFTPELLHLHLTSFFFCRCSLLSPWTGSSCWSTRIGDLLCCL